VLIPLNIENVTFRTNVVDEDVQRRRSLDRVEVQTVKCSKYRTSAVLHTYGVQTSPGSDPAKRQKKIRTSSTTTCVWWRALTPYAHSKTWEPPMRERGTEGNECRDEWGGGVFLLYRGGYEVGTPPSYRPPWPPHPLGFGEGSPCWACWAAIPPPPLGAWGAPLNGLPNGGPLGVIPIFKSFLILIQLIKY
jgi:hypothetical protein